MEEEADRTREVDVPPRCFCFKCAELIENAGDRESTSAWHYHEEKQQFHFVCGTEGCRAETDILGQYGHCPRDCKTNARKLFPEPMQTLLRKKTVLSRENRGEVWEDMIVKTVSHFEALMRHLTLKLIVFPMTKNRRNQLKEINFQKPFAADGFLEEWFDIGLLEWPGNETISKRVVADVD